MLLGKIRENAFEQKKKKLGLKFNPELRSSPSNNWALGPVSRKSQ